MNEETKAPLIDQEFSIRGLHRLVQMLKRDPGLIEQDWIELSLRSFVMTEKQRAFLASCPPDRRELVQAYFRSAAEHVRAGGQMQLKVTMEPDNTRTLYLMSSARGTTGPGSSFIDIACCDANCGDWHWC